MKKPLLFAISVIAISCSETPEPQDPRECMRNGTGTIYVGNQTNDDYTVFVDGVKQGIAPAKDRIIVTIKASDDVPVKLEQRTGYVISQKVVTGTVDVSVCEQSGFYVK